MACPTCYGEQEKQAAIDAQAERVKKAIEKVNGNAEVDEALVRAGLPPRAPVAPELNLLAEMQLRAVGHTSESAAHVVVCSPVAGLHLSEKAVNGMVTVDHSSPAGTLNLVL